MSETQHTNLSGISETLLITLYLRAQEAQRADALLHDEQAVAVVNKLRAQGEYAFSRIDALHLSEMNKLVIILRCREFDRDTRAFLARHPNAVVVHIGCGLDTRFERTDNGQVEWYDLDLPEVIELRRQFIGGERARYHLLGCSALENIWLDAVRAQKPRPFLFLAEGVFMYFYQAQVKALVLTLRENFLGAELIFDAYSPLHVWRQNLQMSKSKIKMQTHWGIWRGQALERWADGIRLLDEWGYFDTNEPRLAPIRPLRVIETLARTFRIYHFRLGNATA